MRSRRASSPLRPAPLRDPSETPRGTPFPVVGIGGSAGGLEAFRSLLSSLSSKPGMALVFIMHLAPDHKSMLADLLARSTKMPVTEVRANTSLEADHVYVMPANARIFIANGKLILKDLQGTDPRMPIDGFFHSLAQEQGDRAIGVVLSGTASDGTLGAMDIKAAGGITFAQDSKTAQYGGMPQSAVVAGCVDRVASPKTIAKELERIARHPFAALARSAQKEELLAKSKGLEGVFDILRAAKGLDFTFYKTATISRRISRRMALLKLEDLKAYAKFLRGNKEEIEKLYEDLLINVTSFFRDPEVFRALKKEVLPAILKGKVKDGSVRVWVPGCSTGEEAYSIAICLVEALGNKADATSVQIFATDMSERSIQRARKGLYGQNIKNDLTPERLKNFFVKAGDFYQVSKRLREMCIFSKHNIFHDPPFGRLDLVSCRNLSIYFQPALQRKMFHNIHYALNPGGFLLLGNSESAGSYPDLFTALNRKQRIFVKKYLSLAPRVEPGQRYSPPSRSIAGSKAKTKVGEELELAAVVDGAVLAEYASCGVLIDGNMDVVQFRGHTGRYLESASGKPSLNLLRLAREGLFMPLRVAVHAARKTRRTVRSEADNVRYNHRRLRVQITVIPIKTGASKEELFLVLFDKGGAADAAKRSSKTRSGRSSKGRSLENEKQIRDLRRELVETKEYLQATIEEKDGAYEELKTANEEILSANEELQSANEELETSKEELQSANEELTTSNDELQNRNTEIFQLNDDLTNLLSSINMPIVMLGIDLTIRRLTPQTEKVLNIIPSDVGRPIQKIKLAVDIPDLERVLSDVIESLHACMFEAKDKDGRWFSIYVRPYRTTDNKIDGVVMIFVDVSERKKAEEALMKLTHTKSRFASMVSHELRSPLAVIAGALDFFGEDIAKDGTVKQRETLGLAKKNIDRLRRLINSVLDFQKIEAGKMEYDFRENDINEMVREVHASMSILLPKKDLELRMELEEGLSRVRSDRDKIVQVLMNLVGNAIKCTSRGSVLIKTRKESGAVHIEVRDTGEGIAKEEMDKLFMPFEKVDGQRKHEEVGTGLGLAISKEFILGHQGKIWVESEVGSGTVFHFTLPL